MPRIDAVRECPVERTFRVEKVAGMFDLSVEQKSRVRISADMPDLDEDWQIGAVVGPSGAGKSTVIHDAYPDSVAESFDWPDDLSVLDGFDTSLGADEITQALSSVGFSSPPAWVRPYRALSNGQQFRADLARALLANQSLVVVDEFTSVIDRTVAKVASAAVAKTVRKGRSKCQRLVVATCHYDVLDWLEPDWVLDMASGELARGWVQRRPEIEIEVCRTGVETWRLFAPHHYLSTANLSTGSQCYVGCWGDTPVAFGSVMQMFGMKGVKRLSRTVVLPDFQGVGIGSQFSEALARVYTDQGYRVRAVTANPALIHHRRASDRWRVVRFEKMARVKRDRMTRECGYRGSPGRATVSFEYVPAN